MHNIDFIFQSISALLEGCLTLFSKPCLSFKPIFLQISISLYCSHLIITDHPFGSFSYLPTKNMSKQSTRSNSVIIIHNSSFYLFFTFFLCCISRFSIHTTCLLNLSHSIFSGSCDTSATFTSSLFSTLNLSISTRTHYVIKGRFLSLTMRHSRIICSSL